jgi:uncharacterized protein (TIGR02466 family)
MKNIEVYPLFSSPVMHLQLDMAEVNLSNINWGNNYTNSISSSQNVLDLEEFASLREQCQTALNEYFYKVMSVSPDVEIYITESWFNKTEEGQVHHRHWHPNSIVSAVVFLQNDIDQGGEITLITSKYEQLEFEVVEPNIFNSKSWSLPPLPGTALLFPSGVEHLVDPYRGKTPRISLSFNSFVRGDVNKLALTKLKI